jgi:hypothetical protein
VGDVDHEIGKGERAERVADADGSHIGVRLIGRSPEDRDRLGIGVDEPILGIRARAYRVSLTLRSNRSDVSATSTRSKTSSVVGASVL